VCHQRCRPFPRLDSDNSSNLCSKLILQISNIVSTPYKKRSQKGCTDGDRSCNFPSPPPEGELTAERLLVFQPTSDGMGGGLPCFNGREGWSSDLVCVAGAAVHFHSLTLRTASSLCPKLIPIDSANIQHCEHAVKEEVAEGLHR
jgi:hypothetical protein